MGRNYGEELGLVRTTATWASSLDLTKWADTIARAQRRNLVVVASGGSVAAAQLLAYVHTQKTGRMAIVQTPLNYLTTRQSHSTSVCFISAGGANNDILNAWQAARSQGVQNAFLICATANSPLATLANATNPNSALVFDIPSGRDGFLATNSLIAFCVLILKLYGIEPRIPANPAPLSITDSLLERNTLLVLYGGWLHTIALDIESRFSEAALGNVQIIDFRNFAHGRHHWLAKRGTDSAVIALLSPQFATLAQDTLDQFPSEVITETWSFSDDVPTEMLLALSQSFALAGLAATRLGYDAGRPGVPEFGHRIYELNTKISEAPKDTPTDLAILRKCDAAILPSNIHKRQYFGEHLAAFQKALADNEFRAVVLDYDGTVVDTDRRLKAVEKNMAAELNRLLSAGICIGFATGRGKSIHERLCEAIDQQFWQHIIVGYYNGGVIRSLSDKCDDITNSPVNPSLQAAEAIFFDAPELVTSTIDVRPTQITINNAYMSEFELWLAVKGLIEKHRLSKVKVVSSSHSVDIIPDDASKTAVVAEFTSKFSIKESEILKIGDRGKWPGNDAELLAQSHGLSVDEVSASPTSCWNLLPHGLTGSNATLFYLRALVNGRINL